MLIGELARRTDTTERLLRYYEEQGLLSPGRTAAGYRLYEEADVAQVRRIRTLLTSGLNTATIAQVLPCLRDDDGRLVPTCPQLVGELHRERARLTDSIEALRASRDLLDEVITAAPAEFADRAGTAADRVA
ncbi:MULTISPECIES: MerR family transcriptional regulator [unclassified Streptomyces]|uniref:MerR family transcriptional regulator n=1 Tax=Streptomyces sp. SID8354 TaxID=2690339 RepID=UPI0004777263|nr:MULTISPECIES: MerR family transcriptional regulator [unclassified Streptomyces]MYT27815.1 MerR family transcriptional regulator [Streptomyces sp. SID8354]